MVDSRRWKGDGAKEKVQAASSQVANGMWADTHHVSEC